MSFERVLSRVRINGRTEREQLRCGHEYTPRKPREIRYRRWCHRCAAAGGRDPKHHQPPSPQKDLGLFNAVS